MKLIKKSLKSIALLMAIFVSSFMALSAEPQASNSSPTVACSIIQSNGKYGLKDKSGRTIVQPKYKLIYEIYFDEKWSSISAKNKKPENYIYKLFKVCDEVGDDYKYGLLNSAGEELLPVKYDAISGFRDGFAIVKADGKCGFIKVLNIEDNSISNVDYAKTVYSYDHADSFVNGLARVQRDNKWGFIDKSGAEVITCKWDDIYYLSDGLFLVESNKKRGFINQKNELVLPCIYDDATDFHNGIAAVCENMNSDGPCWKIINHEGKSVSPILYDDVLVTDDGHFYVMYTKDDETISHFISDRGERIDFPEESHEPSIEETYRTIHKNGKTGLVSSDGQEILPCEYNVIGSFFEGFASIKKDGKWGFINTLGKIVVPCIYDEVNNFKNGFAVVRLNQKCGFVNPSGKLVIPCDYEEASNFMDGWANVNNCIFINENGEKVLSYKSSKATQQEEKWRLVEVTAPKFDDAALFSGGHAPVRIGSKCGYINTDGEMIIPLKYDAACEFSDGMAAVKSNNNWGFVDTTGNLAIPCKFRVRKMNDLLISPYDINRLVNREIEMVEGYDYDDDRFDDDTYDFDMVGYFHNGLALVDRGHKFGYINKKGEIVIPIKYKYASYFTNGKAYVSESSSGPGKFIDIEGRTVSLPKPNANMDTIIKVPVYKVPSGIQCLDDRDFETDYIIYAPYWN